MGMLRKVTKTIQDNKKEKEEKRRERSERCKKTVASIMKNRGDYDESSWALYLANKLNAVYTAQEQSEDGESDREILIDAYMRCFCDAVGEDSNLINRLPNITFLEIRSALSILQYFDSGVLYSLDPTLEETVRKIQYRHENAIRIFYDNDVVKTKYKFDKILFKIRQDRSDLDLEKELAKQKAIENKKEMELAKQKAIEDKKELERARFRAIESSEMTEKLLEIIDQNYDKIDLILLDVDCVELYKKKNHEDYKAISEVAFEDYGYEDLSTEQLKFLKQVLIKKYNEFEDNGDNQLIRHVEKKKW